VESFETSFGMSQTRLMPACALLAPSVAYRNRTSIAPTTAVQGSALPWISDVSAVDTVVDVKGFGTPVGIRSWSPPV